MPRKLFSALSSVLFVIFFLTKATPALVPSRRLSPADSHHLSTTLLEMKNLPIAITDAEGRFVFTSVPRATHQVYVIESTLPAEWQAGLTKSPVKLALNPGMTGSRRLSPSVVLEAHYHDGVISGAVFADLDYDGHMSAGDVGLAGVSVVDPPMHQYYVPFYGRDLWQLLSGVNRCQRADYGDVSDTLESTIVLTASADDTQWFYDHWEDGYDEDPFSPGSTTMQGTLNAGQTQVFRDTVDTTDLGNPANLQNDGRDRITMVGVPGAVIRMVFPTDPGVVLSTAWEVPEVLDWDDEYIAMLGEDLDFNGAFVDDFDYAGLDVMAAFPDTRVYYNGTLVATLGPGQAHMIAGANDGAGGGGVNSSDVITASAPIQVQSLVGGCAMSSGWSAQGYTLLPIDTWGVNYWAPVPDFTDGVGGCNIDLDSNPDDDRDVDIYIHNPHDNDITVTLSIPGSAFDGAAIPVPAHTTQSVLGLTGWVDLPPDANNVRAIHLASNETYWAVAMVDSSSAGVNEPRVNDWGYSLIPQKDLSSRVVIGWGPGNNAGPPPTNNANQAFVTAIADTVVFVDLNGDDTPDAFDMNGDGDASDMDVYGVAAFDEPTSAGGVPLAVGQVLRVGDPNDRRLRGALIYTQDLSHKLAIAWGQDACAADRGELYLDLGYTALPVRIPLLAKIDDLATDADSSGDISPGDTLTYTVTLENTGFGVMSNVVLTDELPYPYVDFVLGSIASTSPHDSEAYDDGSRTFSYTPVGTPGTPDPAITAFRLTWASIEARSTVTVTFRVVIQDDIPVGVSEICNFVRATSDNTDPAEADSCRLIIQQEPTPTPTGTPPTPTPTTTGTPLTPTSTPTETPPITATPPPAPPRQEPPNEIPEPLTIVLIGAGLAALAVYARRRY
jgi:uncharacterized repeat protein (TIGR01451 family)